MQLETKTKEILETKTLDNVDYKVYLFPDAIKRMDNKIKTSDIEDLELDFIHVGWLSKEMISYSKLNTNQDTGRGTVLNPLIESICNKMNLLDTLDNVKTIYRFPKISLSRDKVKMWTDENDAKVIRDSSQADVSIFSQRSLNNMFHEHWYARYISKQDLMLNIEAAQQSFKLFSRKEDYLTFYDTMNSIDDNSFIYMTNSYYRYSGGVKNEQWREKYDTWFSSLEKQAIEISESYVKNKSWSHYKSYFNGNFMLDATANKLMSTDSVTFDDETYMNVKKMIQSNNSEDITVAMTTIANCNIEESKTYLGILFFHFNENYFKRNSLYNTVLFKSVRTIFQKYADLTYGHTHSHVYDKLVEHLVEDDALTVSAMEHILDIVFEKVIMSSTGLDNSKFTISRTSIALKPEILAKITDRKQFLLTDDLPF